MRCCWSVLSRFRLKHSEVYSELAGLDTLADLRASTAIFSTIDDHEVTDDFAGGADVSTDPRFDRGKILKLFEKLEVRHVAEVPH